MVWTIVAVASLAYYVVQTKHGTLEEAKIQARAAYEKDIIYRRWNAGHGGVYVPVTEKTQPNPYLSDLPERDITTPSGKVLTLMNPAYMTRQAHELQKQKDGIRGHITSLHPIRPENTPDPWEAVALRAFERRDPEISSVQEIEGREHIRLMRPLITEKGCLKCHAKQGYHEGDIRGGISVSIPMEPFRVIERRHILTFAMTHILLWLAGLGGIVLGTQKLRRSEHKRKQAEEVLQRVHDELEIRVQERTAELLNTNERLQTEITERKRAEETLHESEERYRAIANNTILGITIMDTNYKIIMTNTTFAELFRKSPSEFVGKYCFREYEHRETVCPHCPGTRAMASGNTAEVETYTVLDDGSRVDVRNRAIPLFGRDGAVKGFIEVVENITEQKKVHEALDESEKKYRNLVDNSLVGIYSTNLKSDILYANDALVRLFEFESLEEMMSESVLSRYKNPKDRDVLFENLKKRGIVESFEVEMTTKKGKNKKLLLSAILDGDVISGMIIDITELKQAEEQIKRQFGHLTALRDINKTITSGLDLNLTLKTILEEVSKQLKIDAADILLLNPHMQTLEYADRIGFHTTALQHTKLRVGKGFAGQAAYERRIITIPNISEVLSDFTRTPLMEKERFISYFAAPLIIKGQVKGILELFHRSPLVAEHDWLDFLDALATQAAIAIDNAELFNNLQRSNIDLILAYDTTIEGWAHALDYRDKETEGHSRRVTEMTVKMARAMGISEDELVHVRRGGITSRHRQVRSSRCYSL